MFSFFSLILFISSGYSLGCELQVNVASSYFASTISIRFLYYFLLLHKIIQIFSLILKVLKGYYLLLLLKHNQAIPYHTPWRWGKEESRLLVQLMPTLSGSHPCSSLFGAAVQCDTCTATLRWPMLPPWPLILISRLCTERWYSFLSLWMLFPPTLLLAVEQNQNQISLK